MKRTLTISALTTSFLFGAGSVALLNAPQDVNLSSLPPSPEAVEEALNGMGVTLIEAVEAAEKATGGNAASAEFTEFAAGPAFRVQTFGDGEHHVIFVDSDGQIADQEQIEFSLPGDPVEGDPVTTDSGLMYYDIVEGDGPSPASSASVVQVHYTGWLLDGSKFDSSVDRGQPATFPLNGVIPGWTEGVGSMKVGGKRKLIIPYELAYGEQGRPPVIPGRAMLVFDVELLDIVRE